MTDENAPYYQDAAERQAALDQILECTRHVFPREHIVFRGLLAEVTRLRADLAQRTVERDEARRDACHFQAQYEDRCVCPPYMSIKKYVLADAMRLAKERGWDCWKEAQP
jgi:hypothetical protein